MADVDADSVKRSKVCSHPRDREVFRNGDEAHMLLLLGKVRLTTIDARRYLHRLSTANPRQKLSGSLDCSRCTGC